MAKKYKKVLHLKRDHRLAMGAVFILLGIVTLFYFTRGVTPSTSELSFAEKSSVAQIAGSVLPASCESGVEHVAGECAAVWSCDNANPANYCTTQCCTTSTGANKCGTDPGTQTPSPSSNTYPIANGMCTDSWNYYTNSCTGIVTQGPSTTSCSCNTGYYWDGSGCSSCTYPYDNASDTAIPNGTCHNTWTNVYNTCTNTTQEGAVTSSCSCNAGYTWNGYGCISNSCPADTPYTETNASAIATYCGSCPSGYHEPSSLSCDTGGAGTWQAYGANCTPPSCGGCGCIQDSPTPVNGSCSATHYNCNSGTSGSTSFDGTTYRWTCYGSNGGTDGACWETGKCQDTSALNYGWGLPCTYPSPVNGSCSATHYNCNSGTSGSNSFNGTTYSWTCTGSNGGSTASCSEAGTCQDSTATNYGGALPCTYYTPMPDLTAGSITPTSVTYNSSPVALSATITNQGDASTGSSFSNFLQVATASGGGGTITDLSSVSMSTLAAGASNSTSQSYTFPAAGTYSVRACADKTSRNGGGVISESNEGNNCGAWTDILVARNPSITNQSLNFPNITFTCMNSDTYSVTYNEAGTIIGQGSTVSGRSITVQFSQEGNYTIRCMADGNTASVVLNYTIPPLTLGGMSLLANPVSVNVNKPTAISWSILNPKPTCSLSAQVVCSGGHTSCSQSQLADESSINTQLQGSTDANDPYGGNRNIQTAVQSPYTQYSNKAAGKKTLLMNYTTDFILDCGSSLIKKVRVSVANQNEG